MATHDVGDLVALWIAFRDADGVQADPTTVALTLRLPDGTVEEVEPVPATEDDLTAASAAVGVTLTEVTGVYGASFEVDQMGPHWYRWEGTGIVQEVEEAMFNVRVRNVPEVTS